MGAFPFLPGTNMAALLGQAGRGAMPSRSPLLRQEFAFRNAYAPQVIQQGRNPFQDPALMQGFGAMLGQPSAAQMPAAQMPGMRNLSKKDIWGTGLAMALSRGMPPARSLGEAFGNIGSALMSAPGLALAAKQEDYVSREKARQEAAEKRREIEKQDREYAEAMRRLHIAQREEQRKAEKEAREVDAALDRQTEEEVARARRRSEVEPLMEANKEDPLVTGLGNIYIEKGEPSDLQAFHKAAGAGEVRVVPIGYGQVKIIKPNGDIEIRTAPRDKEPEEIPTDLNWISMPHGGSVAFSPKGTPIISRQTNSGEPSYTKLGDEEWQKKSIELRTQALGNVLSRRAAMAEDAGIDRVDYENAMRAGRYSMDPDFGDEVSAEAQRLAFDFFKERAEATRLREEVEAELGAMGFNRNANSIAAIFGGEGSTSPQAGAPAPDAQIDLDEEIRKLSGNNDEMRKRMITRKGQLKAFGYQDERIYALLLKEFRRVVNQPGILR